MDHAELDRLVAAHGHDTSWTGSDAPADNLSRGVRINVKCRGAAYNGSTKVPSSVRTWVKTSWYQDRDQAGGWTLCQDHESIFKSVELGVFSQPNHSRRDDSEKKGI